jgi:hypothetical protein
VSPEEVLVAADRVRTAWLLTGTGGGDGMRSIITTAATNAGGPISKAEFDRALAGAFRALRVSGSAPD